MTKYLKRKMHNHVDALESGLDADGIIGYDWWFEVMRKLIDKMEADYNY